MGKIIDYINNNLDIGVEYQAIFGREIPNGKFSCPFHTNVNTPSAKRYGNGIRCFGHCQRWYSVYDLLKRFNPERINEVASSILIEEQKQTLNSKFTPIVVDRTQSLKQILDSIIK